VQPGCSAHWTVLRLEQAAGVPAHSAHSQPLLRQVVLAVCVEHASGVPVHVMLPPCHIQPAIPVHVGGSTAVPHASGVPEHVWADEQPIDIAH
jgi:hypothetical protein